MIYKDNMDNSHHLQLHCRSFGITMASNQEKYIKRHSKQPGRLSGRRSQLSDDVRPFNWQKPSDQ